MYRYILKRIFLLIPVILGVIIFIFIVLHLSPGDPAQMMLGDQASQEDINALREQLGLNDPLITQLGHYLLGLVQGDFGTSYMSRGPVINELLQRFPTTLLLAVLSITVMVLIGLPLGMISATKQYSLLDSVSMTTTLALVSMPPFWTGMLMVLFFSLKLGWLPASGFYGPAYWILPALAIGIGQSAFMARMVRSSMLEVIRQDYIRTARAKGQIEKKVIWHHALRNALIPIITVVGNQLGMILGGAMVTESVFSIPGVGIYMLSAINSRDYPAVQGGVIFIAVAFSLVNLLVDVIYAFIDPRISAQYKSGRKKKIQKIKSPAEEVAA